MSGAAQTGGVRVVAVAADEEGTRLDRWFRRHHPHLTQGRLQKLLRTGQIRVDGKRADANARLAAGQAVRVPPLGDPDAAPRADDGPERRLDPQAVKDLLACVVHRDDHVIALNKPAGLATQGGTGTVVHVDGLLDALRFGRDERPRLVHRLDKDTSGLLLLARSPGSAARLAEAFRARDAEKVYWAIVVGVPKIPAGRIDLPLAKQPGIARHGGEAMAVDEREGDRAITDYRVLDRAHRRVALLELRPLTGRTHQLRVHCEALGTPILGDPKYGGGKSWDPDLVGSSGLTRGLCLHHRRIALPHPAGGVLKLEAKPPRTFEAAMDHFGLSPDGTG